MCFVDSCKIHRKFRKIQTRFCWTPGEKLYNFCYSCLSCFLIFLA
jgi:hypothetical protein